MPRSRLARASRQQVVKPDPDAARNEREVTLFSDQNDYLGESDAESRPARPLSTRFGRSDAPAPSEPGTEPGPLLREVRARNDGANISTAAPSPSNQDTSFFQTSFQDIGKKLKECNDTLGELQQLGVSHDVQLPELVLVGDQSAGKSSLMSGLANLELPRSEGTCTRCPLHIRVSRNSDWSCHVRLRKEYAYRPPPDRQIEETDVTDEDPFFPWRKMASTSVFEFKTMHDKSEIEDVLRWAQIAILNDDQHPGNFVPGTGIATTSTSLGKAAEETAAKFSPNIVALEIKGPDLPDLSFYDMPGIFENPADARDDYLVNVVRNLTKAYISHLSAIIICCMPMNSDAENSSTFGLTRRLHATSRTIGVLTKADLLPEGNHEQWLSIMRGDAHSTGLGYFITSRPQGKDLADLTKWEERVFETHSFERWPESFRPFSAQCGIERLKAFLSERLGKEFAKSLPIIKQKVSLKLEKIRRQLSSLPELPENVELEIQTGLIAFADSSRAKITEFIGHFNVLPRNFRDCLLDIKPKFTLKDRSDIPVLEISDDESDVGSVAAATPTPKRPANHLLATPSKRQRPNGSANGTPVSNGYIKPEETGGITAPPRLTLPASLPAPFTEFKGIGRGFRTLRQVREEMQAKTKAGMPDRISDEVYVDLVKEAVMPWNEPTLAFVRQAMKDLQAGLDQVLGQALESLKKRFVYTEAKEHVQKCLEEHRRDAERALMDLHNDEKERLLTFNEGAFKLYKDEEHVTLTRFRHNLRAEAAGLPTRPLVQWGDLTEEKRAQDIKRRENDLSKLGPDQLERELEVIAYVRGYYRLAALRYADAVSQRILCRTIPAIRRQLPVYLEEKLGLRAPGAKKNYERLMAEDEQTASKREGLKAERDKFDKALASISLLETGAWRGGPDFDEGSTQAMSPTDLQMDGDVDMAET